MPEKIITNNVPRDLLCGFELSDKERAEFDYVADPSDESAEEWHSPRFFRYRGNVYDTNEFVRILSFMSPSNNGFEHRVKTSSPLIHWDGIATDSFFSGVVIRYARDDSGSIIVGVYTC